MINLELFGCAGGMAEGFRRAGIEFEMSVDIAQDHCDSYEANLGHRPVQMDVRDLLRMVQLGWRVDVDLIVADPPCTPWSRAGKRLGQSDDISAEPLLSHLYLTPYLAGIPTRGTIAADGSLHTYPAPPLDLVIAGCESGPGARPIGADAFRSLRDQCAAAGVAFFLKQAVEPDPVDQPAALLAGIRHFPPTAAGKDGSHRKPGGIIGAPYLDGVQHLALPEVPGGH